LLIHRLWYGDVDSVYYINGSTVLPPPLSPEEELEALNRVQQGDQGAKDLLITHNLRLVVYIARKFESSGVGLEDLISIGTIGLIKAVRTFCPGRNIKLATYSSRCIENEILMYLRKNAQRRCEISIDEPLNVDWDGNELLLSDVLGSDADMVHRDLEAEAERRQLLCCVGRLPPREQQIMCLRFGICGQQEHTQKEVADRLGISQSYISRLEKRIIRRLREEMQKEER
jgi:RNA polymerase sporulation-specific sigma factor